MSQSNTIPKSETQRDAFAGMVGALLLNFGSLEFISYRWAEVLSTDKVVRDLAIEMPLARRIGLIKRLIDRSNLPEDEKSKGLSLWNEVLELGKIRNSLAHNPLLERKEQDGSTTFGVINFKEMKGAGPFALRPVLPADVHSAGCRAGAIVGSLTAFINRNFPKV